MSGVINNIPDLWKELLPVPKKEGNKYDRGHVIIGGGEWDKTGAAKISARCALRIGAGLVSVACDKKSLPIYATSFQAVMTKLAHDVHDFSKLIADDKVTGVLLGPAGGVTQRTREFVLATLELNKSIVLDADALTVFSGSPEILFDAIKSSKSPCILTPHEGEFTRLFGKIISDEDRISKSQKAVELSGAIVILKGSNTVIAHPDGRIVVNNNATAYLATAGSGDALAGICVGLLAQKMSAFEAACASVWLHAEAGTMFGAGLIAEDISELLPDVLKKL